MPHCPSLPSDGMNMWVWTSMKGIAASSSSTADASALFLRPLFSREAEFDSVAAFMLLRRYARRARAVKPGMWDPPGPIKSGPLKLGLTRFTPVLHARDSRKSGGDLSRIVRPHHERSP